MVLAVATDYLHLKFYNIPLFRRDRKRPADKADNSAPSGGATTDETPAPKKAKSDLLTTKTGGAYIPPARLRMMQAQITDKTRYAIVLYCIVLSFGQVVS